MQKRELIMSIVSGLKPGESAHITGDEDSIIEMCAEIDVEVKNMGHDIVRVHRPKDKGTSMSSKINKLMHDYKRGHVVAPYPSRYVRQIVSKYNASNNENFKVTATDGDTPKIYKEIEDCKFITQDDFDVWDAMIMAKRDEMLQRIVVDDHFESSDDDDLI